MQCPNCGTNNEENFRFCLRCGSPLPVGSGTPLPTASAETVPAAAGGAPLPVGSGTPLPVGSGTPLPPAPPPAQPSYSGPAPQPNPPYPPQASPPGQPYQPPQPYSPAQPDQPPQPYQPAQGYPPRADRLPALPFGEAQLSSLNIWGPFAGYGSRRRHLGWLMDGKGEEAPRLIKSVEAKFGERKIPNASVNSETLVARGLIVESRPYFVLRRGLVSLGLYIAQFGRDLYVSLVSYLKPPISNFRVLVLGLMALFWLYSVLVLPGSISNAFDNALSGVGGGLFGGGGATSSSGLYTLLCLVGPLSTLNALALLLFLLYSVYKYVTEKDFWAGLRVNPNEFNEDDLMALEKAVEQTVRASIDEIGLDVNDLVPVEGPDNRRLI